MGSTDVQRRLSAILMADVKSYSRLMGSDEEGTLQTLRAYRNVMLELIESDRGRVVSTPGDAVLAEFGSVVDAVTCATEIQRNIARRNASLPEEKRMDFRIGINLGDVMDDGDSIYGDGVNIAARLEALADPGGVCISGSVYDSLGSRGDLEYEFMGEQTVRNIVQPVRTYRVVMRDLETPSRGSGNWRFSPRWWKTGSILAALLVAVLGTLAFWKYYDGALPPKTLLGSPEPKLPANPSIAVLPFKNLSGDPQQEYFSDGITNDIITDLSKFPELFVIASNSVFTYKGKPVKVQQVAEDLAVRYVLEGSVQKDGDRVRINAQLIDATTGQHLWADRFERETKDLFGVQDEIVRTIVATLATKVDLAARGEAMHKETGSMEAYDYYVRGRGIERFSDTYEGDEPARDANEKARQMYEKAAALDAQFARAYAALSQSYLNEFVYFGGQSESLERAHAAAQKAVALDDSDYFNHWALADVLLYQREYEKALAAYDRAYALNPNDANFLAKRAEALIFLGLPKDAIVEIKQAMRLNPIYPVWYQHDLALAYYHAGSYKDALETLEGINSRTSRNRLFMAATYAQLGQKEKARAEAQEYLKEKPSYTIASEDIWPYKIKDFQDRWVNGLRKAGLPGSQSLEHADRADADGSRQDSRFQGLSGGVIGRPGDGGLVKAEGNPVELERQKKELERIK